MGTKRESRRIQIELHGHYRIWESDFPYSVITLVNISHTGICFKTDEEVESGNSVELKIKMDNGKEISLLAKVIWSNAIPDSEFFNTGVQIMNTNSDDAKKFVKFYNSKLLYPPTPA